MDLDESLLLGSVERHQVCCYDLLKDTSNSKFVISLNDLGHYCRCEGYKKAGACSHSVQT